MGIISGFKRVLKPFVDVPAWIGYKNLVDGAKSFKDTLRELFTIQKPQRTETFEEAMQRLNLTETDIQRRIKEFSRLVLIFGVCSILIFIYSIYLIWQGSVHGCLAGFALTFIMLTFTFRYHFWLFQVRQRKLGCTLREWLDSGFAGNKK